MTKILLYLVTAVASCYAITDSPAMTFRTLLPGSPVMAVGSDGSMYVANLESSGAFPCATQVPIPGIGSGRFVLARLRADGGETLWTVCLPAEASSVSAGADGTVSLLLSGQMIGFLKLRVSDATVVHYIPLPFARSIGGLAVDRVGGAYVGFTAAPDFTPTPGSIDQSHAQCTLNDITGCRAAVLKISAEGAIEYATYLGVENSSAVSAIQVDSTNAVWIAGSRRYSEAGAGPSAAFAVKLDASGKKQLAYHRFDSAIFNDPVNPTAPPEPRNATFYDLAIDKEDAAYLLAAVPNRRFLNPPSLLSLVIETIPFFRKVDAAGVTVYDRSLRDSQNVTKVGVDDAGNVYVGSHSGAFEAHPTWPACSGGFVSVIQVFDPLGRNQIAEVAKPGTIRQMTVLGDSSVYVVGELGATAVLTPGALIGVQGRRFASDDAVRYASKLEFARSGSLTVECVENAATLRAPILQGRSMPHVAPGELITIFGSNFPPADGLAIEFDGVAAPVLYADGHQINAVVPFEINSSGFTRMLLRTAGRAGGTYEVPSTPASPGTFGWNKTQAAALNEDGSVNTAENGAFPGSIVTIFVSGAGKFTEPVKNGDLGSMVPPFAKPARPLGVYLQPPKEGRFFPAEVLSAVQAPGLIHGVVQVNLRLPATVTGSQIWVFVADGGISSENTFRAIMLR